MTELTELSDWLLGQIAADEDEAEHMWGPCDCDLPGFPLQHGLSCKVRVLAECEAKRCIVGLATKYRIDMDCVNGTCDPAHTVEDDHDRTLYNWSILRALASVYADHPDYRSEWRP